MINDEFIENLRKTEKENIENSKKSNLRNKSKESYLTSI